MTGSGTAAAVPAVESTRSVRLGRVGDELLARYAARGNARAFTAIYHRYHQQLYRYCRSIVRIDADAEDALQATFTAAISALRRDQRRAPLRPWLFRIAHNEAISILRQRRRQEEHRFAAGPTATASSEERFTERARWTTLMSDIGELPERQRSALVLRELNGLSHEEIAIALDTSVGGAKQAIFEARQALLAFEEGRAMTCDEVRHRLSDGDRRVLRGRRIGAHLRGCTDCAAFATAISARRAELRAFVPALAPATAAGLLIRSSHAASGAAAIGGTVSTSAAVSGTAIGAKALTAVVLVATATAGATGLSQALQGHHAVTSRIPPARQLRSSAAGTRARVSTPRVVRDGDYAQGAAAGPGARTAHRNPSAGSLKGKRRSQNAAGHGTAGTARGASRGAGSSASSPSLAIRQQHRAASSNALTGSATGSRGAGSHRASSRVHSRSHRSSSRGQHGAAGSPGAPAVPVPGSSTGNVTSARSNVTGSLHSHS